MSEHDSTKHALGLLVHHAIATGNHSIFDSDGRLIASYVNEHRAAYICRAVNAHEALVAACIYTLENLDAATNERLITCNNGFRAQLNESRKMLRAALARVKGGAA